VLGTDACRFAAPELAGGITAFGHEILRWTKAHLEGQGLSVLYGDTDSLFVDPHFAEGVTPEEAVKRGKELSAKVSQDLAEHLQGKYRVTSRLELKFEKYYRWFLLPSSRGGHSRAKSYAGWIQDGQSSKLDIVGMEAVRSDWTPLARDLQRQLLQLLFAESPPLELKSLVRKTIGAVRKGQRDTELVYQKRMRRELTSYTSTTPPHVKAARLLPKPPRVVRYLMTLQGPQPLGYVHAQIDYEHYISKQVLPIVATVFDLVGFDAEEICLGRGQERLF
jgi:DNA polymerase-2